jgi:hypothetical protein
VYDVAEVVLGADTVVVDVDDTSEVFTTEVSEVVEVVADV